MVFRNPAHTQAYAIPSIQYAQPNPLVAPNDQSSPVQHLTAPQPTIAATFVNPTIDGTAVLPAPESTAVPTLQYAVPQLQYAHQPLHLQPVPDYAPQHQLHNTHLQYQSHYAPQLDFFHSFPKHHPSSLLDTYIPSSLLYAAQRQRNAALLNRQLLHTVSANFPSQTLAHPTHFYQQGSHQPGYNTIAYSTAQGYSKRSPKLVTERPLKHNKRN